MQYLDSVQIQNVLVEYYNLSELQQLCARLDIDYEALGGRNKSDKARAIVRQMQREDRLEELAEYIYGTRPFVTPEMLEPHIRMEEGAKGLSALFDGGIFRGGGGLDEAAPPTTITTSEDLRLDAAFPAQVQPDRSFELAVAIRQSTSPALREEGLEQTASGNLQVEWPDGADSTALRIHISAPDCDTHGQDEYTFRLRKGQDSPVFYFQLTPKTTGRIGIVVTVYQEQEWLLGMARLHTDVRERISGTVEMSIQSHPIIINNYGDTYTFSGDFHGSNINIKSMLKDVNQTIGALPRADAAKKEALQRRIAQLNRVLQQAPPDKVQEADAVAQMADALVKSADSQPPNRAMMEITGEGLKQAAVNLAGIVPDVVHIAEAVVAGVLDLG